MNKRSPERAEAIRQFTSVQRYLTDRLSTMVAAVSAQISRAICLKPHSLFATITPCPVGYRVSRMRKEERDMKLAQEQERHLFERKQENERLLQS